MRAEQSRAEQSRAEQSRAEQSRAEQSRAEQSRAEQSRAEQSRAEQSRAEQSRAEQSRAEQSRAEQSRAEQSRAEQSRAEQSRAEQSRAEQSRAEQSRAEQSRAEQGEKEGKRRFYLTAVPSSSRYQACSPLTPPSSTTCCTWASVTLVMAWYVNVSLSGRPSRTRLALYRSFAANSSRACCSLGRSWMTSSGAKDGLPAQRGRFVVRDDMQ
ncbi:hypothetical protein MKX07_004158 [Trichoderma sp. CBMAI-0711]|nr:hypothetical protein MKX07_004158 [Trichoderma sp. CBMAI-0711]